MIKFGTVQVLRSAAMAVVLAAAVVGCSREDASDQPSGSASVTAQDAAAMAGNMPGADAAASAPVPTETASATPAAKAIPMALRGRWGLVPLDCTSTMGDAKGLVEIGADSMKFYESRAKLTTVKSAAADSIRANYAFAGEGQEWTQDIELKRLASGKMERIDRGEHALAGPLIYSRCAG